MTVEQNQEMKNNLTDLRSILAEGNKALDLHVGIISQIKNNLYSVVALDSAYEQIVEGAEFDLNDTYCKEVYDQGMTKTFKDVAEIKEMQKHPVYLALQLRAYVGTPIIIDNKVWGTLNYSSVNPRNEKFFPSEYQFIESQAKKVAQIISENS